MDNLEKREWLQHEIAIALINDPISEHITFECPWKAKFRVVWDSKHLSRFSKKVAKCYGFKNHRKSKAC